APFSRVDATTARMVALATASSAQAADPNATLLAVDDDAIRAFRAAGGGALSIPSAGGATVELELEPYALFAEAQGPTYTDDRGRHAFTPDVSLFRGHVAGDEQSWAVVAMSGSAVFGVIEQAGARQTLAPVQRVSGPNAVAMGVHVLAPEGALSEEISRFQCGINADNEVAYGLKPVPLEDGDRLLATP